MTSASTRPSRGRASATLPAGSPKVMYLVRSMPLLLLAIWPLSHLHIFMPDAVELVLLFRDVHLVAIGAAGTAVDKGELKGQGTVKVV